MITDKQVEAACHFYHDPNNWLLLTESARQNYRAMMRGAIDLAISAATGAQPSADDAPSPEPFRVGNTYRTRGGGFVRFVSVENPGKTYETMVDEFGVHRYTNRVSPLDRGRVTGMAHGDNSVVSLYAAPPADARDGEDARRYRWLRDHASSARGEQPMVHMTDEDGCAIDRPGVVCPITDSSLDAAIDRAMGGE